MTYPPPPPPPSEPPPYGAPQAGYPAQQPDSNLVWGILCAVLCCLPFGIVSIVYAAKVSGLWTQGRYAEAQKASADAKKWAIWGAVAGVIVGIIYAIIAVAGGMSNSMCCTSARSARRWRSPPWRRAGAPSSGWRTRRCQAGCCRCARPRPCWVSTAPGAAACG